MFYFGLCSVNSHIRFFTCFFVSFRYTILKVVKPLASLGYAIFSQSLIYQRFNKVFVPLQTTLKKVHIFLFGFTLLNSPAKMCVIVSNKHNFVLPTISKNLNEF